MDNRSHLFNLLSRSASLPFRSLRSSAAFRVFPAISNMRSSGGGIVVPNPKRRIFEIGSFQLANFPSPQLGNTSRRHKVNVKRATANKNIASTTQLAKLFPKYEEPWEDTTLNTRTPRITATCAIEEFLFDRSNLAISSSADHTWDECFSSTSCEDGIW